MTPDTVLDMLALAKAARIKTAPDGHSHNKDGWTHFCCPWCRDHNYHLGYHHQLGFFNCLKCGRHPVRGTAIKLLRLPADIAATTIAPFYVPVTLRRTTGGRKPQRATIQHVAGYTPKLPAGCGLLTNLHWQYLLARGYDPETLEEEWGLLGTGGVSDKGWKFRVIIPVTYDGQLVSYQGRDVTGKSDVRYRSCPDAISAIPIKDCLYGLDRATSETVIIVEGPTSVWRIGPGAVCTFGTGYTAEQARILRRYRRRFICFDNDGPGKTPGGAGKKQAAKLAADMDLFSGETYVVTLPDGIKDPDEMNATDIQELRRSCGIG